MPSVPATFVLAARLGLSPPISTAPAASTSASGEISSPEQVRGWTIRHQRLRRMTIGFGVTLAVGSTVGLVGVPLFLNTRERCRDDHECAPYWSGVGVAIAGGTAAAVGLIGLIAAVVLLKRHERLDPNPPPPSDDVHVELAGSGLGLRF